MKLSLSITVMMTLLLSVVSFGAVGIDTTVAPAYGRTEAKAPIDVRVIQLHDDQSSLDDTLAAADTANLYGPYTLAGPGGMMVHGFRAFFGNGVCASGDSLALAYQTLPSGNIRDTVSASWTFLDTIESTGEWTRYATLDNSTPATHILFKIVNIDATAAFIAKNVYAVLQGQETVSIQRRE